MVLYWHKYGIIKLMLQCKIPNMSIPKHSNFDCFCNKYHIIILIIAWIGCTYETWLLNIWNKEGFTLYTFLKFWNYQTSKFWSYSTYLGKTCTEKTCLSNEKIIWWQCPNQVSESHISLLHYHTWYCLFNNVSDCWSYRIKFEKINSSLLHSSFFDLSSLVTWARILSAQRKKEGRKKNWYLYPGPRFKPGPFVVQTNLSLTKINFYFSFLSQVLKRIFFLPKTFKTNNSK